MPATYSTPNVYVVEESLLPPSVAQVSTAVPAFIGYTETGPLNTPMRISTLLEYENLFGLGEVTNINVTVKDNVVTSVVPSNLNYLMYQSLRLFFDNGGSTCYVVSAGNYQSTPNVRLEELRAALKALNNQDEPTLLVSPDAVKLNATDFKNFCKDMLDQCASLKDRFAIFDVQCSNDRQAINTDIEAFRGIASTPDVLKYGAAYYPYLQTTLSYRYSDESVTVASNSYPLTPIKPVTTTTYEGNDADKILKFTYQGTARTKPTVNIKKDATATAVLIAAARTVLTITLPESAKAADVVEAYSKDKDALTGFVISYQDETKKAASIQITETAIQLTDTAPSNNSKAKTDSDAKKLSYFKNTETKIYSLVKAAVDAQRIVLPSSAAVAGVYAQIDYKQGVWKAPANVGMSSVVGPTIKLNDQDQDGLNIDTNSGKSINVIRSFTGKGTLVWGARTLAGNDNEWRYIPVRRLFIMIEESIRKAIAFAVFEPNVAMTWLKVKTTIESYLDNLWRQGALAGATAEQAYFVQVGLNKTMTQDDINNGYMRVKVGIAPVRPAEFIVLTFSQKSQEA